jgi:hypothetical protein
MVSPVAAAQTLHTRPSQPIPPEPQHDTRPTEEAVVEVALPEGTSMQVEIARKYPMKTGETIEGYLVYPLYVKGKLLVPANTPVRGTVVDLQADTKSRWHARLRGDLTPFHTARVEFTQLALPSGTVALHTNGTVTGAAVLHLTTPGAVPHRSFLNREWSTAKSRVHDRIASFTAPGLGERGLDLLYHQLPYHPEYLPANTAWTFELATSIHVPAPPASTSPEVTLQISGRPEVWTVHALLTQQLNSATARPGDEVKAIVVEPVYGKDKQLVVPQGSTLVGKVTSAMSARSLGRSGKLRFSFQQMRFPSSAGLAGSNQPIEGAIQGATAEGITSLSLDSEGTITPKSQSSAVAPLLLTLLAGRALDEDGNMAVQTGVASNGFGLVGRIVGVAAGDRNFAAGLGFYAAALSTYENFIRRGRNVDFPKGTRIDIETTPLRSPALNPVSHP